ncbi:MAG TPA: glycosyltransferase [Solirubrobacter sp.]|nr:glycosyltransferase [Solirubrobacter sp.]
MPVVDLKPGQRVDAGGADTVVCVPLHGAHEEFKCCLRSLLRHTHADVPILIADDADPDPAARTWVGELERTGSLRHTISWLRQEPNLGFPGNCNAAFAASAPADVAVVNSDCEVGAGWLEGLRAAAYVDTNVASSTALTNHGSIVSVPWRNRPQRTLPGHLSLERASARVREEAQALRPRIPTLVGHCFFVRRSALDLVGAFDEVFSPGYGEEVDFSQRCIAAGLQHVVADEVLVLHRGGASLGESNPIQAEHEKIIRVRYPWYEAAVADAMADATSPLARTLALARQALLGLRVTIDGRILTPTPTGSQINTIEFIDALWRTRGVNLRVIVPPNLGEYARDRFADMDGIELVSPERALADGPTDIVHRPYQISSGADLHILPGLGDRIVLTHLDVIAYRNPTYFGTVDDWLRYRSLTRAGLAIADLVSFCTRRGADDALADGLVEDARTRIIPLGADHGLELDAAPRRPDGAERLEDTPFLLCLGTDFKHKNRVFALRLLEALRERHGWDGMLVLAGPHVARGSSDGDEAGWLAAHEDVAAHVVTLGALDEHEKAWLLGRTAAVLYPTTYEGFGFLPFEAGLAGKPCFFAHVTSMAETLDGVTGIVQPWDVDATADAAIAVLRDEGARRRLVAALETAIGNHTWQQTARMSVGAYRDVLRMPAPMSRRAALEILETEAKRGEFEGRYWALRQEIGPTGFTLVGEDGRLPDDAQRALSALTQRSVTRGPLVAGLRFAHRVSNPRARKAQQP